MEDGYRLVSREFDDAELRILIDSVLFSKSISTKQAKDLITKLQGLASNFFKVYRIIIKDGKVTVVEDNKRTYHQSAILMWHLGIVYAAKMQLLNKGRKMQPQ